LRHKIAGPAPQTLTVEVDHRDGRFALVHGSCRSHEYDALHERCVVMVDGRYWIVSDWLRAPTAHRYRLNFQLSARAQDSASLVPSPGGVLMRSEGLVMAQPGRKGQDVVLAPGWVSDLYGHKHAAPRWVTDGQGHNMDFDTVLVPVSGGRCDLKVVDGLAVCDDGRTSSFLRIDLDLGEHTFSDGWWCARGGQGERWTLGEMAFVGRWLHWRTDADGWLIQATSHPGAELTIAGARVALDTGEDPR
jgi:Heparinase II/III-like protein